MSEAQSNDVRRVLVDVRALQGPSRNRGIGTYVRGLIWGLAARGQGPRLAVLIDQDLPAPDLPDAGLVAYAVKRRYHGRFAPFEEAVLLGSDLSRIRPLAFHATELDHLPASAPCPVLATVHDLIPWAYRSPRLWGERVRYSLGRKRLRQLRLVLAVSEATAADAVRLADVRRDRIRVIPEAASPEFQPRPDAGERVRRRWNLESPYLLYVGALDARKDPAGLLRAWAAARSAGADVQLVLAGAAGAQAPASMGHARRLGYVDQDQLVDLLSAAGCLVFPSRYEGFGLPVLEAMSCGCPVAAYSNSSLPELVGTAATLVADGDPVALGRAAAELILDRRLAVQARQQGLERARLYSWDRVAAEVMAAYSEVVG